MDSTLTTPVCAIPPLNLFNNIRQTPCPYTVEHILPSSCPSPLLGPSTLLPIPPVELCHSHLSAHNFLWKYIIHSPFFAQHSIISIDWDRLPTMQQLHLYGTLSEIEGTKACRSIFNAVVLWDDIGYDFWKTLKQGSDLRREPRAWKPPDARSSLTVIEVAASEEAAEPAKETERGQTAKGPDTRPKKTSPPPSIFRRRRPSLLAALKSRRRSAPTDRSTPSCPNVQRSCTLPTFLPQQTPSENSTSAHLSKGSFNALSNVDCSDSCRKLRQMISMSRDYLEIPRHDEIHGSDEKNEGIVAEIGKVARRAFDSFTGKTWGKRDGDSLQRI